MVFGGIISSPRGNLAHGKLLELAQTYLGIAGKALDPDIALVLCHDTEVSLSRAKKNLGRHLDQTVLHGIATTYIGLGQVLKKLERHDEAKKSFDKAGKLGASRLKIQEANSGLLISFPEHGTSEPSLDGPKDAPVVATNTLVEAHPTRAPEEASVGTMDTPVHAQTPSNDPNQHQDVVTVSQHLFYENSSDLSVMPKLPKPDERLRDTHQLVSCLSLLKASHSLDDLLGTSVREWIRAAEKDDDEQERLKTLSLDVIRTFKREEIKDSKAIAEVTCLAPILDRDTFRDILNVFCDGISQPSLLDDHLLHGLAQLIQGADHDYLEADDLVKILEIIATRLQNTHKQSPQHMFQLTMAASHVLDAMADTNVKELDRKKLHAPLSSYLDSLKGCSEPYLAYQVAYAYQALQCVPDDETLWQASLRRTGKVIRGVSGLVSAVKGLDLNGFVDGLKDIQQGLAGATEVIDVVVTALHDVGSVASSGKDFIDGLKEGFSFKRKCAWYAALRGADALIRSGDFSTLKALVCSAPCRWETTFQWGICQRLGEIASNRTWGSNIRRHAVSFLGEMYKNDKDWRAHPSVKEWIVMILIRLSSSTVGDLRCADTLLRELETSDKTMDPGFFAACRSKDYRTCPLYIASPVLGSPSLLDRVQNKPDVETSLRQLRRKRLNERGEAVYIHPQAKANLQTSDDDRFPLREKIKEFMGGDQKVFLLLGDSGAGKSTFNRQLESDLWTTYTKSTGTIPLFINLPAIESPEHDMIAKQLRKSEFTEPEIRELKDHRKFILICDGYDESQQTHNLYMSNKLNQPGEWTAQMVISCRSEYLGVDYRDRFQPGDRNKHSEAGQFQEAVIAPFSEGQISDYIKQYVSIRQQLWKSKDYKDALDRIPSLKELVKNPFLMTLTLEVLPRMMDPGKNLSTSRITRVALYDQFIEHWLERGKKRLGEKDLSPQGKAAFESLIDEGFIQNGIDFMKRLCVAIYKEQDGQPIVSYSRFKDEGTWKESFFNRDDDIYILREACPLVRSGNQYRFIHRSLLEYGLALAIFDPRDWKDTKVPDSCLGRRGSAISTFSFRIDGSAESTPESAEQGPDMKSPLAWRYFVNDPSILQYLSERVQQDAVFKQQLLDYIEHSKKEKRYRIGASNAMTILVRAGVQFNGADLRGIQIPGADLSHGRFDSAQLHEADLRQVNLRNVWLRQADLKEARMTGAQFGESPYLEEDDKVASCAYSSDGKTFAVSLHIGTFKLYSTSSQDTSWTLKAKTDFGSRVLAYTSNLELAATASRVVFTLSIWDVQTGDCTRTLTGHIAYVLSATFSPSGDMLASSSYDETMRLWNTRTGDCHRILRAGLVATVAYSPNGNQIASGDRDGTVRLWDVMTGDCTLTLTDLGLISCVAYSPDGQKLASAGNGLGLVWDLQTESCRTLSGFGNMSYIAFSPLGNLIVSAGDTDPVRVWDTETEACRQKFAGHSGDVVHVVFSPNGDRVASCSDDKTVRFWDIQVGPPRDISTEQRASVSSVKYLPQTEQIACFSYDDGSMWMLDAKTREFRRISMVHKKLVGDIEFSPRGPIHAATSGRGTLLHLMDWETGLRFNIPTGDGDVNEIFCSPRGDRVASVSYDHTIKLWVVKSGDCSHILHGHTNDINGIAFSPNGDHIISGGWDLMIRQWNIQTGCCSRTFHGHTNGVWKIVYSPDGGQVATSSSDRILRLWSADPFACTHILIGHTTTIRAIAYSPQGDSIASAGDKTVRLWDSRTGDCRCILTGHTDWVTSILFIPDGSIIITTGWDRTLRLWDTGSGQCRAVIHDFQSHVASLEWAPTREGNYLVTHSDDKLVRLWKVLEGDSLCLQLCWSSWNDSLVLTGASIERAYGLSNIKTQLMKQRGAVGDPSNERYEASKKLVTMASVVSRFMQPVSEAVFEPSSANCRGTEQPESEMPAAPESEQSE